ncbi:HEAT repeat-containing [Chlorella sorokiniana]|uniref:HEAT repeat-containing n=1 Tax=Chlorella sorokiniana TaxID=3076 RepID=A0A2P6TWX9_CHLSO|nr:HEAT repeat-containing [Chlorella sorokiniana]|eukprot:PRW58568.1 HEAT repeat-containing [Chlorella sorokiniana]
MPAPGGEAAQSALLRLLVPLLIEVAAPAGPPTPVLAASAVKLLTHLASSPAAAAFRGVAAELPAATKARLQAALQAAAAAAAAQPAAAETQAASSGPMQRATVKLNFAAFKNGGLPMRQQRSAAERPARAPPPTKTHPAKPGQHAEEKAEAVWSRFKGQPRPAGPTEPGKEAVKSVAEAFVSAGPSAATAAAIIRAEPAVLQAPPASVAAKMHSLSPLTTDAVKSRQALYRKLGPAAARTAVLGLDDAAFQESVQLLSELVGSARTNSRHPQHDKAWEVLQGCDDAQLSALLCDHSAPQLHQLLQALQQHLGWDGSQAASALLGFAGTAQVPSACPHTRFRQLAAASPEGVFALSFLLRRAGMDYPTMARLTLTARTDWSAAALSAAALKAAVRACHKATGLPESFAVTAWLAGFGEPPLLGLTRALVQAGVGPEQVGRLAQLWLDLADQASPEQMVQAVATQRWALGDWQAAVAAVLKAGSL